MWLKKKPAETFVWRYLLQNWGTQSRGNHSSCFLRACVCSLTVTQGCDRTSSAVKRLSTFTCSIWLISSCGRGGGVEPLRSLTRSSTAQLCSIKQTRGLIHKTHRLGFVPLLADWLRPSPGTGTPASLWGSDQIVPPAHCSHWGDKQEQRSGTTAGDRFIRLEQSNARNVLDDTYFFCQTPVDESIDHLSVYMNTIANLVSHHFSSTQRLTACFLATMEATWLLQLGTQMIH